MSFQVYSEEEFIKIKGRWYQRLSGHLTLFVANDVGKDDFDFVLNKLETLFSEATHWVTLKITVQINSAISGMTLFSYKVFRKTLGGVINYFGSLTDCAANTGLPLADGLVKSFPASMEHELVVPDLAELGRDPDNHIYVSTNPFGGTPAALDIVVLFEGFYVKERPDYSPEAYY